MNQLDEIAYRVDKIDGVDDEAPSRGFGLDYQDNGSMRYDHPRSISQVCPARRSNTATNSMKSITI